MAKGRRARVGDVVESATRASERLTWLDRPSYRLEHGIALGFTLFGGASDRVRNLLNGTNVGHPVHPAVATVPVGAWTAALVLDVVDTLTPRTAGFREAARLTVGVGVAGSAAAALTGLADWQYTHDEPGGRVWCTASSTPQPSACVSRPGGTVDATNTGGRDCAAGSDTG
jgi:hypothetical protein